MSDALLDVISRGVRIFDLGRPMTIGMPQSQNHPAYWHTLPRRHGDMVRADGGSAANDLIVTGTHVGTHIDALAHVSHDGRLHGGADAADAGRGGRFMEHGVHTIAPMVRRAVLLDVPAALGLDSCEAAYEITPADLEAAEIRANLTVQPSDVVLALPTTSPDYGAREWWHRISSVSAPSARPVNRICPGELAMRHIRLCISSGPRSSSGTSTSICVSRRVPGIGEAGAQWLAERRVHAAGADTIAFERLAPGSGHSVLPAHRVLLVETGIYIVEALALEELAAVGVADFTLVLVPMNLVGATGSPVRPLAVLTSE